MKRKMVPVSISHRPHGMRFTLIELLVKTTCF